MYLYSVFSHMNEALFLSMLHETARVVREGGFVFTTLAPRNELLPGGFPATWRADAGAGRFIYIPTGGGHESMPSSVWAGPFSLSPISR